MIWTRTRGRMGVGIGGSFAHTFTAKSDKNFEPNGLGYSPV